MHIDDEPDIREVVELSLRLDPELTTRSCASGSDALSEVDDWSPDLILLDVMMPVMDGPATLARLREKHTSAEIPVVFMTARAQPRELEYFRSLGAAGVIAKPFDPMTLSVSVRGYLKATRMNGLRANFLDRTKRDAVALSERRMELAGSGREEALTAIKSIAHGLAGAAGIYGLQTLGREAALLEAAADAVLNGDEQADLELALDRLVAVVRES
jgi:CheY-like chemotaxis protein